MTRSRSLAAIGAVVLVGVVVAALVLTAPWPSGPGSREKSHPGGAPTPLAIGRSTRKRVRPGRLSLSMTPP